MLVLSRKVHEEIVINEKIRVCVLGIGRGRRVRLGVEAPRDQNIRRAELPERKDDGVKG